MTFDLAQMIADREAGTQGEWDCHFGSDTECQCKSVVGDHGGFGAIAIICSDNGKRIGDGGNDAPSEPEAKANARRIASVPSLEAEIERLTARVAELTETAQALGAMPEGYCFCSENRIGDDSKTHEPECHDLRAALEDKHGH